MKNSDPIFWPSSEASQTIKQMRQRNYEDSINILQTQWYQADLDQRFCMGDQDLWGLIFPGVSNYRRKIFNFNIINPIIQAISGHQRQTRKSTICIPTQAPMQKTADQLTKCLYYIHGQSGAYQIYSDAFEQGALTQGLGFISIFKDLTNDPISGDIRLRYIDMKSCLFDPYFRRHDMSDARFFETRQFFDKDEAALLYPDFADEILSLPKGSYRDDKFYYMPEVYNLQFPNLIAFDESWYLSSREATYIVDVETNETQEFTGDEEDLRVMKYHFKDRLKVIKKTRPSVNRAIVINDRLIVDEKQPYGLDRYPYVPCLAYFTPDTPYYAYKFRGVTRDLRDSQYLLNMRKVADLDILSSQQQGLKAKKGALITPSDSMNQGNGRVLFIDPKFQMDDVQPMQIVPPSPVMLQMEDMLMNIAYRIAGMDPASMGIEVDDKAGIISMMRQAATARNLQRLFDQFDECQRLCGDIIVEMIQKNWTYGKVRQVIGEEPTPEFDNKLFFKYGCKVIQGSLTETQQQLELQTVLYLHQNQLVQFTPREILELTQIQNKGAIMERMDAQEKAKAEQEQKMAQLQMQQLEIENQTKLSYSRAQDGLAAERIGKLQLDKALNAERIQQAQQDRSASVLNVVKAIKELQGMDINMIAQALQIVEQIKDKQELQAEENAQKPLTQTSSGGIS